MKAGSTFLDMTLPMKTCPVCGKEFLYRPDWALLINTATRGHLNRKPVCSIRCMRQFEDEEFVKHARKAETFRCMHAYKLRVIDGASVKETKEKLGYRSTEYVARDVAFAECMYHKEIAWLEENGWTA